MSDSDPSARPRQLIVAGGFVIAASVILLVAVFDAITNLHSVETRDTVAEFLSSPLGESLDLSIPQVLSATRVALMVTGLCAAAAVVLGVFVFQRHRGARIALSVVAVPILVASVVTAPLTGVLLGALIVAATVALWTGPAGDWFAGRPVRQTTGPGRARDDGPGEPRGDSATRGAGSDSAGWGGSTPRPAAADLSTEQPSSQPPPTSGFGERPVQQPLPPPQGAWGPPGGVAPGRDQAAPVPAPVKVACLLTWVFSGVVALVYAVLVIVLIVAHDELVDLLVKSPEWQRADLDTDLILPVLWLGCLMFLTWSVGALVLAWFTWRRHNWARYLLAASAGAALVTGMFAFPVGLLHQAAAALVIAGLFSARSRAWFDRSRGYGPPGPPYGPPPGPPPGQHGPQSGPPPYDRPDKPPVW